MAHQMTTTDFKAARFNRTPAWHRGGTVVQDEPLGTMREWNADWFFEMEARDLWYVDAKGQYRQAPAVALVRADTRELFGTASDKYRPLQQTHLYRLALAAWGPERVVETVGTLKGGRRSWIQVLAEQPADEVAGDEFKRYSTLATGHDGGYASRYADVATRIVCANTWQASGIDMASAFYHVGKDLEGEACEKLVEQVQARASMSAEVFAEFRRRGNLAAQAELAPEDVQELLANVWIKLEEPDHAPRANGNPSEQRSFRRMTEAVTWMTKEWEQDADLHRRSTRWEAFNAVTAWYDHGRAWKGKPEGEYDALLLGELATRKTKAEALLLPTS